tara:strand:+ start:71710 stop:72357 length:648 start_codon:yes stop_codon:yes gene_type:complete
MPSTAVPSRKRDPGSAPAVTVRWQDVLFKDKMFYYASAVDCDKLARVFTVHFTYAVRDQLSASSLSARDFLSQRMRSYLTGIPYFFVLDINPKGVLHIHGLLNPTGKVETDLVQKLHKVAGDERKITKLSDKWFFRSKAVDYKPADWATDFKGVPGNFGPYGWNHYITKTALKTKKVLGVASDSEIISVSQSVTRLAKQFHKEDVDFGRSYSPKD